MNRFPLKPVVRIAALGAGLFALTGCASIVNRASERFADNLGRGILNQDDPATVAEGLPAYLLLLDGLLEGDPDNAGTLRAAARLYGAYAGNFVAEPERAARLSKRAFDYAQRAACIDQDEICGALKAPYDAWEAAVAAQSVEHAGRLYALGSAWAGYIQTHSDDYAAIAAIPRVSLLLERAVALEPGLDQGMPHVYLGVLNSLRPAAVGGQPEQGRAAFERAIELSQGRNLMARTLLARHYARLVFDQELHDGQLKQVLEADPKAPGLTLMNTLAQAQARILLDDSKNYF
ncbi:TRAP transporter TatT component family protein [Aquimonas voraii]|uniref:TRAP transporter T-component n=1 Tax=Aquimonas voraii TaxID=265719 RepID=A0A1G6V4T6_9GAMM|nr:TRAP transporter TatT component family protein [Aquimonas voraii]SDD47875.1 TRAP transporter T-component [Aquimonas voraii]